MALPIKHITKHRCFKNSKNLTVQQVDIVSVEQNVSIEQVLQVARIKGIPVSRDKMWERNNLSSHFIYDNHHANDSELEKYIRKCLK